MARLAFFSQAHRSDTGSYIPAKIPIAILLVATVAIGLAFGAPSVRSPAAQASGPFVLTPLQPFGLIAVKQYDGCPASPCPSAAFADTAANNPAIAGLMIRVNWRDMQPSETGPINWGITDSVFSQVAASADSQPRGPTGVSAHKFVVLAFVPGFDSPSWVLTDPAVATAAFCVPYGAGAGKTESLPLPWDATYLADWSSFLSAVAAHYASNPAFLMIAAAGPTSVSDEMSLPGAENSKVNTNCTPSAVTADIGTWKGLTPTPYTPDTYETAWGTVFQDDHSDFPSQYTSFSLYPGLPVPGDAQKLATPKNIILDDAPYLGDKFALQVNGLTYASGGPNDQMYSLVKSYSGKAVTGLQLVTSATKDSKHWLQEGGPTATDGATALSNALKPGLPPSVSVDFLEVYEDDAASTDPGVQSVLQNAESQLPLPQFTGGPPTRPACPSSTSPDLSTCT